METQQDDYRIVLEAGTPQSRIEVMKCSSKETANEKAGVLAKELGLQIQDTRC